MLSQDVVADLFGVDEYWDIQEDHVVNFSEASIRGALFFAMAKTNWVDPVFVICYNEDILMRVRKMLVQMVKDRVTEVKVSPRAHRVQSLLRDLVSLVRVGMLPKGVTPSPSAMNRRWVSIGYPEATFQ